jgi:hypothetical protein
MRALQLSENPPVNLLIRAQHRRCPSLRGGLDNPPMASQVFVLGGASETPDPLGSIRALHRNLFVVYFVSELK